MKEGEFMFKKIISIVLCILTVFTLTACAAEPDYSKTYNCTSKKSFSGREELVSFLEEVVRSYNYPDDPSVSFKIWIWLNDDADGKFDEKELEVLNYKSIAYHKEGINPYDFALVMPENMDVQATADAIEKLSTNKKIKEIWLSHGLYITP